MSSTFAFLRLYNGAFLGTEIFPRQLMADPAMPRLQQMGTLEAMTEKHCVYIQCIKMLYNNLNFILITK